MRGRSLARSGTVSAACGQVPHQVVDGLSAVLLDLADQRPLFLGIDDLHYADEASLQGLLYFFRRLGCARVLAVVTEAVGPELAHPLFRTECQAAQVTGAGAGGGIAGDRGAGGGRVA